MSLIIYPQGKPPALVNQRHCLIQILRSCPRLIERLNHLEFPCSDIPAHKTNVK